MTEPNIGFWQLMKKMKNSKGTVIVQIIIFFKISNLFLQIFRTPRPHLWCGSVNGWTIRTSTDLVTPFVMKALELSSMIWPNSCYSAMEGKFYLFFNLDISMLSFFIKLSIILKIWKLSREPFRSCLKY